MNEEWRKRMEEAEARCISLIRRRRPELSLAEARALNEEIRRELLQHVKDTMLPDKHGKELT
jgi:hypothetical protein